MSTQATALGKTARALIADPANDVLISVASLWEIVVKARIGKRTASIAAVCAGAAAEGFVTLDIRPAAHHRDPFDHLLLAQALTEGLAFVSADQSAPLYPLAHVPAGKQANGIQNF